MFEVLNVITKIELTHLIYVFAPLTQLGRDQLVMIALAVHTKTVFADIHASNQ